jgi:PAS domain S-box-containing protein
LFNRTSLSWFYPKPTGDPGRDRNARTVQFACFLLASAVSTVAILNVTSREPEEMPLLFAVAGLLAAMVMNRAGRWKWAARIAFLALLLTALLLVLNARDGFRSTAMLVFPGMLLISVMFLDRVSYIATAGVILIAVASLGLAERQGLTRAIPGVRSPTTYESIFFVDLTLLVFAMIGSRIARDGQKNVFDLHGTVGSLSEANLKLAETAEALRESEQQLASIYNAVRDVIFHVAVEPEGRFRFVSVNAAFLRVTGLSRETVVGKAVNEVIPEPSLAMVIRKYGEAIERKTTALWQETSDYPSGRLTGEVSVVPVLDNNGICTHLVGSVHDITERHRAEAALRENEARLKNAERLAHVGNWRFDFTSKELSWSEEMFRIFGREQDYTPSFESVLQAVVPDDRQRLDFAIRDHLALKGGFSIEFQIARPNGDVRAITCYVEVVLDEQEQPQYVVGACHDLTELRRAQKEDFARQKLESLGTLASGIAHDFNNLLGSVVAQSELASMELDAGKRPKRELEAIQEVALRGSEIVRELMVYAGKEGAAVRAVDVSRTVNDMIELLRVSVSKRARLETYLGSDLPAVRADAAQIQQIVLNLVTNASQAIEDRDGVIRLTTSFVKAGRNSSGARSRHLADGDHVRLEVSDTGRGLPPELQAKVFDPFFTTKPAGHGLGLAIVDGVVRSLGGEIHLASEPGKGTKFEVLLPCEGRAANSEGRMSPVEKATRFSGLGTVLVIEDEDLLRQASAKVLRNSGFDVLEAADGSAAIDVIRGSGSKVDVLFLDMTFPGPSCREVVAEYARVRPDGKVILTSAYSEEMAKKTISAPQIRGFVRKPFHLADVVKTVRNTLSSIST